MKSALIFVFAAFAFLTSAFSQGGIQVNTGLLVKEHLNANFPGSLDAVLQVDLVDRLGNTTLQGLTNPETLWGVNVAGSSGFSVTIAGVAVGYSVDYKYVVTSTGKILVHYKVVTLLGSMESDIDTGLRSFIFSEPTEPLAALGLTGALQPFDSSGGWHTFEIPSQYGYFDSSGTLHVIAETIIVTIWVPAGEDPWLINAA